MSKEDEDIAYARKHFPNVRVRKATEEKARFGQHRIYFGPHQPVAKMPKRDEDTSR